MALSASDIKFIRSLQQKKFRKQHGLFVVEGVKPVQELLQSSFEIASVYSTEQIDFLNDDIVLISNKELGRISGLKTPNMVLAIVRIPEKPSKNWNNSMCLLLDGISDPGNLGTIIRTAKWFGVTDIFCTPDCVDAYDRKVVQSTMGALFHVNVNYSDAKSVIHEAELNRFTIVGTTMNGQSVYSTERPEKTLLIIGSESQGMSGPVAESCEVLCSIPNFENEQKVESLNAGIATAIMLSELTRKSLK